MPSVPPLELNTQRHPAIGMPRKVALVAGATGVVGRALLEYLEGQNDWI